jgi:pimeloyl-ACP methyl ester carboxylesterase
MHVHRFGGGPDAFFCLHGWGGSHLTYGPLAPHVPSSAALYAADLPGYGRSAPPSTWSAEAIGDHVAEAIVGLGVAPVTLVGNCSGAVFGLIAAQRRPDLVGRIVMVDAFAFLPWYFKIFVHRRVGAIAYRSTFANPVGRWLTNASLRKRRAAGTDLTHSFRAVDHEVSLRYLEALDAIDGISRFRAVSSPVDIVYGERTFGAVKTSAAQWQTLWPQARRFELAGAGHLPIEEATRALASILFAPAPAPAAAERDA